MNDNAQGKPLLSVVTVVRNDLPGLLRTLASAQACLAEALCAGEVEHIVIDGSSNGDIRDHLQAHPEAYRFWISESDRGIYDAMNKGLTRSRGRYALFMNAGDVFSTCFKWVALRSHLLSESRVLIAYAMECFDGDRYVRPGIGREAMAFEGPPHQATFYPRAFYVDQRYSLSLPVAADGEYTQRALSLVGGLFVPLVVAEFALGGVSSNYGRWVVLKRRLAEQLTWRGRAKLVCKFALWRVVSQRVFYRILAAGKYTSLTVGEVPRLRQEVLPSPGRHAG